MHSHSHGGTPGRTLHSPRAYDWLVWVLTLGREARFRRRTLDVGEVGAGERVLDICCGTGTLALAAAERVGGEGRVEGVDASTEMIGRARAKAEGVAHVAFTVAGAQSLPFEDGAFDAVFCTLGLHHLPEADREVALSEMLRVLAPGGRAVIVEFARTRGAGSLGPAALLHRRHGPPILDATRETMARIGFGGVEVGPLGFRGMGYARGRREGA